MVGFLHSTESFGTVDGPGIRYVLFLQGCPLRCIYCHNPDTWKMPGGTPITVPEILAEYRKNRDFYRGGGITATGGEPLMQIEFVTALFRAAKAEGIHTCLDTSGITFRSTPRVLASFDALCEVTDLVMLDLKHADPEKHKVITGHDNTPVLAFAQYLEEKKIPLWIRHVLIPGITDSPTDLAALGACIGTLKNLKALDVLPYHTLGTEKYRALGIPYPLQDTPAATVDDAARAKKIILAAIRRARRG